jgi:putative colanic acid biosynthesis acetyltransferase WcaF
MHSAVGTIDTGDTTRAAWYHPRMEKSQPASNVRSDTGSCPSSHSTANKLARALWGVVWLFLFRPSPEIVHGWRRGLLRLFGARIGANVKVMPSVQCWAPWNLSVGDHTSISHGADLYAVDKIVVGSHVTISQRAFICTASHNIDHLNMPLVTAPVKIFDGAWICAEAYVHPGVTVGVDAVVGVRACAFKNVEPLQVVGGNPARVIRMRSFPATG